MALDSDSKLSVYLCWEPRRFEMALICVQQTLVMVMLQELTLF